MANAPPQLSLSEFALVAQVDSAVAEKMESNKKQGLVCDGDNGCPFFGAWWDLQTNATDTVWYRGQPIFCNGSAIGSFCCISPDGKPQDFDLKAIPLINANVARIGVAIEKQAMARQEQYLIQLATMAGPRAGLSMAGLPPAVCDIAPMQSISNASITQCNERIAELSAQVEGLRLQNEQILALLNKVVSHQEEERHETGACAGKDHFPLPRRFRLPRSVIW